MEQILEQILEQSLEQILEQSLEQSLEQRLGPGVRTRCSTELAVSWFSWTKSSSS